VINNGCQLDCDHCYLQVEELNGPILSTDEWKRALEGILESQPRRLCFSGKEVLLGAQGPRLLRHACRLRDEKNLDTDVGLITNGLNLLGYRDEILDASPDYLDISMDGIEEDHDAVRGEGAFERALPAVDWASRQFGDRFFITLTVQRQNHHRFREAVEFFAGRGVQNINVGFYHETPYSAHEIALSQSDIGRFYRRLKTQKVGAPGTNIFFDLDLHQRPALTSFLQSELFDARLVRRSPEGEVYVRHTAGGEAQLIFRLAPFPTGGWRSCRITPEGDYLLAEDTLNTQNYGRRALGNLRQQEYNFSKVHREALRSDRFREVLDRYETEILPSLKSMVASSIEAPHDERQEQPTTVLA
jgi:MoaA/NifB/PqqE/SkfB family radical SAM enzyme